MNEFSTVSVISTPSEGKPIGKDPWLAVNLAMFFPGFGHLYAGKARQAFFWAIAQLSLLFFSLWSLFSARGQTSWGLGGLMIAAIVYIVSIFHAHQLVYLSRSDLSLEKIPRTDKNPWFAVFASRVIPGLGQLYGNKVFWGLVFLTISLIALRLDDFFTSLLFLSPVIGAIATYHAYHSFPRNFHPHRYTYRSILALMVGVMFGWGIICNYFPDWLDQRLEMFDIPSESMVPTLQVGDRVFVREARDYRPKIGDVVVFRTPNQVREIEPDSGDFFIKRVIATGGDRVQVHQGKVYRNEQAIEEPYIAELADYELPSLLVPPKSLFVLGDNRPHSFDSHVWGFLPEEYLVGRAYKVFWPLERVQSLLGTDF
jgi:signal peptidase I